ncbi:ArsR/SmtB family transcription factor [Rhizobium sp. RAF56]|jgi:DNA-binding transcriptional ArsR family regulator|uniref:ArsR/SmtB family transcription factor n=1 Tax=Rhizobium sp. RAF56 TaxID=3233062 RepID=UPI003F9804E9
MSPALESLGEQQLDAVFHALSDPTRRRIMARLADGEATVSELAEPFSMSLPAVSKHLVVLERAGLMRRRIDGRTHFCSLQPETLRDASAWIAFYQQFWKERLGRLAEFLADDKGKPEEKA